MKVSVLDKNGKELKKIDLDASIFDVEVNEDLLSQYLRVYQSNQRQGTSKAKTRAEVSGGGKKPWRQKGTGRARVGSSRNPLWRHGGISHGPLPQSWRKRLNKKVRKLALKYALTLKAKGDNVMLMENFKMKEPKTSELLEVLKKTKSFDRKILIVLDDNDINLRKSADNINGLTTALADNLNAYEVLLANKVLFINNSIEKIVSRYGADSKSEVESKKKSKASNASVSTEDKDTANKVADKKTTKSKKPAKEVKKATK